MEQPPVLAGMSAPAPTTAKHLSALYGRLFASLAAPKRAVLKYRPYICPLAELLDYVPEGATVFDAGCGCGLLLLALASAGRRISGVGIDTDGGAIRAARLAARTPEIAGSGSTLSFETAGGTEAWPEARFDVVSLIDVLHHVPPAGQRGFLAAAAARVRPGGILIYKDMCRRPLWRAGANRLHDLLLARQWIHCRQISEALEWSISMGLKPQCRRDFARLWYGHELCVFRKTEAESGRSGR